MNAIDQKPNDVDRLLSGFFKSEMPDPFPTFRNASVMPLAASRNSHEQGRAASNRSRFALAASVAILLGGCWYLSGQIGPRSDRPNLGSNGDATANMPKELKNANKDANKKPMMP